MEDAHSSDMNDALRQTQRDFIAACMEATGLDGTGLARKAGVAPSTVNRFMNSDTVEHLLSSRTIAALEAAAGIRLGGGPRLVRASDIPPPPENAKPRKTESKLVEEINVRAGMGLGGEAPLRQGPDGQWHADAVSGEWSLPSEYLGGELGVRPNQVKIVRVVGDSMAPTLTSDDRVMVNTFDRVPSPGGVFALWDGLGLVVKRLEYIPNSDPTTVRIISDNAHHGTYERTLDEVNIIGRVIWFARRL
jgi:transcriptional regulator with XRE-family HTH domain